MVLYHGFLRENGFAALYNDIFAVRSACTESVVFKVILEIVRLNLFDVVACCTVAAIGGANGVKTSAGLSFYRVTQDDVQTLKGASAGLNLSVEACGGVYSNEVASRMLTAGADSVAMQCA